MAMTETILKAALAGLLHDIGKFAQRTPLRSSRLWDAEAEREYVYEHALFSGDFVERYLPAPFKPLSPPAYHHAPKSDFDRLVQRANALSTGGHNPDRNRHPKQLRSIFTRLSLTSTHPAPRYHALAPLRLAQPALFPIDAVERDAAQDYETLWNGFVAAAEALKRDHERQPHLETYLEDLLSLLQRYTWSIPAAYYADVPDVSLYDHSRSTAAIAVCLAENANQDAAALLVGGDISGVQKFIYTLSSKRAAQTLRGRSFYLQLLTEAILRFVLRELGLPYASVIYSGGGHFYLLAPASAKNKLSDIRRQVSEILLAHHGSALYLALGYTEVPANGFEIGQLPAHWNAMHGQLSRSKQNRYTELGDNLYQVFEPQAHGGNRENTCAVCGEEGRHTQAIEGDTDEGRICALCGSFAEDIGGKLPQARFVALGLGEPKPSDKRGALDVLRAFGMQVAFARHAKDVIEFPEKTDRAVLWALDDPNDAAWPNVQGVPTAHVLRHTVNLVPPKDFNDLQEEAHGIARLGVLRMDVDNLGDLFKDGFGAGEKSIATLARISALSFQLSVFFEGWVRRLCEACPDKIYAVYAGGDDVFLIGPWDVMPELAAKIAGDFKAYAAQNLDVHLSGGMAFIHGKYPVYQAAEDAHDSLELAKGNGKNAFGFLGRAWLWDDFAKVTAKFERVKTLVTSTEDGGLGGSQALLQVLQQLAGGEADTAKRHNGRPVWGAWMWHGAYLLTRAAGRAAKDSPLAKELLAIRDDLSANNYSEIAQWGVAARWAQLWLRKQQEE